MPRLICRNPSWMTFFTLTIIAILPQAAPINIFVRSFGYERDGKITVVAVVEQLASIVREIGDEKVDVAIVIPPNVDPHHYEPPADILVNTLSQANLIIVTSSYHFPVENKIYQMTMEGLVKAKIVGLSDYQRNGLKLLINPKTGDYNIHGFHFSINGLKAIASTITEELIGLDPVNEQYYRERLTNYLIRLNWMERTITTIVKEKIGVIIYTPLLQYVVNDLGFELTDILVSEPSVEPSEKDISDMLDKLQRKEALCVLLSDSEVLENPKLLDLLAGRSLPYIVVPLSRFTETPEIVSLYTAIVLSSYGPLKVGRGIGPSYNSSLLALSIIANVTLITLLVLLVVKLRGYGK